MDTAQPQKVRYNPQFKQEIDVYIEECRKNKTISSIKGFAERIGTDEQSIWAWANKKKKDEQGNLTDKLARPNFLTQVNKLKKLSTLRPDNKAGKTFKFKTVEELEAKIEEYFESCWRQKIDMFGNPIFVKDKEGKKTEEPVMVQWKPYTITGLALALDTDRHVLINYSQKEQFFHAIKRAKEMCHSYAEESLFIGKNPTGAIFNLKNNYGWKDEFKQDLTSGGKPLPLMGHEVVAK